MRWPVEQDTLRWWRSVPGCSPVNLHTRNEKIDAAKRTKNKQKEREKGDWNEWGKVEPLQASRSVRLHVQKAQLSNSLGSLLVWFLFLFCLFVENSAAQPPWTWSETSQTAVSLLVCVGKINRLSTKVAIDTD